MTKLLMPTSKEFFFTGGKEGVLLIHGLTGTPNEMRFVGKGLNREGFTVYGMQLAGHCGDEADLLRTNRHDWYQSVQQAAERLAQQVEHLFVAGLSMGALLALKLAAECPQKIAGLGLFGTTLQYDGWAIPPIAKLSFLLPLVTQLGFGRKRRFDESYPYGIKDERIRERIVSSMLGGDSGAAGLPGNPWPSLAEFQQLSRKVRRLLGKVSAPCLIVHASEDDIASVRNAKRVERGVSGPVEMLLLEHSYHMVTVDREREKVVKHSAEFFRRIAQARESCLAESNCSDHTQLLVAG